MKVITRCVIEIASGRVIEEDAFDYQGPVAEAKGGGTSTSTTTTTLPAWLQPYAEQFIKSYQGEVYDENGNLKEQPDNLTQNVAGFTQYQQAALDNIGNLSGGTQAVANTGLGQAGATLSGQYLDPASNPWLDATFNKAARGVTDQYSTAVAPSIMAAAQKSGNFGGSAMDQAMAMSRYNLGENLNDLATSIYGGNYQAERTNQLNTLSQLPNTLNAGYIPSQQLLGAGSLQQQQRQSEMDTDYMNALNANQYPFELLSGFGGALGQAGMGAGTSTVKSGGAGAGRMGSVICTALKDMGIMDQETWEKDTQFGASLPAEVIRGYHSWGIPLAKAMRKSRVLTALIAPFALSWARTMRAKVEGRPENETWLGRQMLRFGVPLCGWMGRRSHQNSPEQIAGRMEVLRAAERIVDSIRDGRLLDAMDRLRWTHHFVARDPKYGCAVYAREMFAAKGTLLVGKIHRSDHLVFLMKGKILVKTDEGDVYLEAPCTFISKAGTKRIGYAEEDTIWTTVHLTEHEGEENLDKIEQEVIAPTFEDIGLIASTNDLVQLGRRQ